MIPVDKRALKLAYIIGTYPEITTTFIDREVQVLREMGTQIQILSIRRPGRFVSQLREYTKIQQQIIYLLPVNLLHLLFAHIYFVIFHPGIFISTLVYLCTRPHPKFVLHLKTLLHFSEGVCAAFLLRGNNWDHLHAHFIDRAGTVALVASRLLDIPYSITAHADDIYSEPILVLEKLSEARFTVTVSEFNRAHLLREYPKLDARKLYVLHPWVDVNSIRPPDARQTGNRFRILSVGRLVENKGHAYLIEACHLLCQKGLDIECNIIGEGPLRTKLETLIREWGLEKTVHLLGEQPQSRVFQFLSHADVFVLACMIATDGKRDGMPVAIAEAMAMEVPVISTDIVGMQEMVQPGTGYLIPARNAAALAEAIRKIYGGDPSSRTKMGKAGRAVIAQHFDLHKGVEMLASLFERSAFGNRNSIA